MLSMLRAVRNRRIILGLLLPALTALWAPGEASAAGCRPNGTALSVTAFDTKFDKDCLAAPANEAFTIDFTNLDRAIPHNVAIYEDKSAAKLFFKGEFLGGPGRITYSVEALPQGTFFFRCDPHPEMNGTFISGASSL